MKVAVIAVILGIMQAVPPVQGKTADDSTRSASNVQNNGAADQKPRQPPPSLNKANSNTPIKKDSGEQHSESGGDSVVFRQLPAVKINAPRRDWADWASWIFNLLLVVVGIAGIIVALRSLSRIDEQIRQIARQVDVTMLQLRAMNEQISEMSQQTASLREYVDETKKIASSTTDAAIAAKQSADVVARVSVPTLVIEKFELADMGAASLDAKLQYPNFEIIVRNYGQTPALLFSWNISLATGLLPGNPVYDTDGILLEKQIVKPGEAYTLPPLYFPHRRSLDLSVVKEIVERKTFLTAYGFIAYGDIFGNPLWRVKFCETVLNICGDNVQWCGVLGPQAYRGIDHSPPQNRSTKAEPQQEGPN